MLEYSSQPSLYAQERGDQAIHKKSMTTTFFGRIRSSLPSLSVELENKVGEKRLEANQEYSNYKND